MDPAAQAVFDTAELLEHVLMELPIRDLLLAQRVCKTWQQAIQGSINLRKILFLEPSGCEEILALSSGLNPHKKDVTQVTPEQLKVLEGRIPETLFLSETKAVIVNPLMDNGDQTSTNIPLYYDEWQDSNASFRKMLLTQPPVPVVLTRMTEDTSEGWGVDVDVLATDKTRGVTIGDVFEAASDACLASRDCWMAVLIHTGV